MDRAGDGDGGDSWWYVCTICKEVFSEETQLKVIRRHNRMVHNSSSTANTLILSEAAHLQIQIKVAHCAILPTLPKHYDNDLRDETPPPSLSPATPSEFRDASSGGDIHETDDAAICPQPKRSQRHKMVQKHKKRKILPVKRLTRSTPDYDDTIGQSEIGHEFDRPAEIGDHGRILTAATTKDGSDRTSHIPEVSCPQLKKQRKLHRKTRQAPDAGCPFLIQCNLCSSAFLTSALLHEHMLVYHLATLEKNSQLNSTAHLAVELVNLPEPEVIITENISMESNAENFQDPLLAKFEDSHSGYSGNQDEAPENEIGYLESRSVVHGRKQNALKDHKMNQEIRGNVLATRKRKVLARDHEFKSYDIQKTKSNEGSDEPMSDDLNGDGSSSRRIRHKMIPLIRIRDQQELMSEEDEGNIDIPKNDSVVLLSDSDSDLNPIAAVAFP